LPESARKATLPCRTAARPEHGMQRGRARRREQDELLGCKISKRERSLMREPVAARHGDHHALARNGPRPSQGE
jgi:hypothetical protein